MDSNVEISIKDLIRTNQDGVVITVLWEATLQKDGLFESSYQETGFPYKSPTDPGFIPFESLNKEQVINWLKNDNTAKMVFQNLNQRIEERKQPKYVSGLPWDNS